MLQALTILIDWIVQSAECCRAVWRSDNDLWPRARACLMLPGAFLYIRIRDSFRRVLQAWRDPEITWLIPREVSSGITTVTYHTRASIMWDAWGWTVLLARDILIVTLVVTWIGWAP